MYIYNLKYLTIKKITTNKPYLDLSSACASYSLTMHQQTWSQKELPESLIEYTHYVPNYINMLTYLLYLR